MLEKAIATFLAVTVSGALGASCPPPPDTTSALQTLIEAARDAQNESAGQQVGQEMWKLWAKAPDGPSQSMLDEGMSRRASFDFLGALERFDDLVQYCPEYAEGYNQRAFVNFLRQDYATAEVDLLKALELSPNHIAAEAGLALTYMNMGRLDEARDALQSALQKNPWLSERHLMAKGGPLALPGEDI